jgi:hypothetical protein
MDAVRPSQNCLLWVCEPRLRRADVASCRVQRLTRDVRGRMKNLRKTARGASSPAKPALHIPELPHSQYMMRQYVCRRALFFAGVVRQPRELVSGVADRASRRLLGW